MAMPGAGMRAVIDEMFRMCPPPFSFILAPARMDSSVTTFIWSAIIVRTFPRFSGERYSMKNIPASLTSTSGSGHHASTSSAAPGLVRSMQSVCTGTPYSARSPSAASASSCSRLLTRANAYPIRASCRANSRPIPELAPVTRAVFWRSGIRQEGCHHKYIKNARNVTRKHSMHHPQHTLHPVRPRKSIFAANRMAPTNQPINLCII